MNSYLSTNRVSRREMLRTMGAGFGVAGLASTLNTALNAAPATLSAADPMAPKAPHFPARPRPRAM
jgi:hypothetical protein